MANAANDGVLGRFFWRELMCRDADDAKRFYGELFGWKMTESDMPGYILIHHDGREIGGVLQMTEDMSDVPPSWQGYVAVTDVDAVAAAAKEHGGTVAVEPRDIPQVGRFTVFGDPAGAHLSAMSNEGPVPPGPETPPVGTFCWETLVTNDAAGAKRFYGGVFGWTTVPGPGGSGEVFASDGVPIADIQTSAEMPPHWMTYVVVDGLADARTRATKGGGKILAPEIPVPEVGTIALIADPIGAHLGLFEAPKG